MKRALAFVVAAAMVGGSLWWRSRDGDDGGTTPTADGPVRVVCATELAAVCDGLDADLEDAGATAARLVEADETDVGAWVVPAPWPEIVDGRRQREQRRPLFGDAAPLGRSRLAMVVWKDRAAALGCAEVTWRCVGDAVGKGWDDYGHPEWGDVKAVVPDPSRSATGLLALGHVAASYFGRATLSTMDLDDPGFDPWFTVFARDVEVDPGPAEALLRFGRARFDVAGTIEAEAAIVRRAASGGEVDLLYPAPMATADAVVVGPAAGRVQGDVTAALREAGWTAPPGAPLPPPGFLDALLARWEQVR